MLAASDADADEERVGTEMSRSTSQVRFDLGVETRVTCTSLYDMIGEGRITVTFLYDGGRYRVRTISSN